MGKRKKNEQEKGIAEVSTKRMRLRSNQSVEETYSTKASENKVNDYNGALRMGINRYVGLSYRKAKRIMAADVDSGLIGAVEKRHVTIGWHQLGEALNAVNYIIKSSLGQYKDSLDGVLLAVGRMDDVDVPLCIADQPCMHVDLKVHCIVFRPKEGHTYKCMVTAVDKKFVTAKLYDTITFFAPLRNAKKRPSIGDEVLIKFSRIEIKGSLCQMKGAIA